MKEITKELAILLYSSNGSHVCSRFTQNLMCIKQRHDNVVETMAQVRLLLSLLFFFFLFFLLFVFLLLFLQNTLPPSHQKILVSYLFLHLPCCCLQLCIYLVRNYFTLYSYMYVHIHRKKTRITNISC